MRRGTLKPREEAHQAVRLHPSYEQDHAPRIEVATWEEEPQVMSQGAGIHRELVHTIRRTLPMVTYEQASHAAHEILALAARTSGRGRRS